MNFAYYISIFFFRIWPVGGHFLCMFLDVVQFFLPNERNEVEGFANDVYDF